nr:MAG TPA: hypothetical protein [Caudoviricetes sp.]
MFSLVNKLSISYLFFFVNTFYKKKIHFLFFSYYLYFFKNDGIINCKV